MDSKARQALVMARILKIAFIVSGLMFLYIVFKIPPNETEPLQPAVELIISAVALTNIVLGFVLPRYVARAARSRQSSVGPSTTPIQRWMTGYVLSLALFESCSLFGLVLHFIGARILVVELLFAASLLAILLRSPGVPLTDEGEKPAQVYPGE
jgi:hypothetical protein